jgi:hypothetical protein
VAGINGENSEKSLSLDLYFLKGRQAQLITNKSTGEDESSFTEKFVDLPSSGELSVVLKGNDGFVAVFK